MCILGRWKDDDGRRGGKDIDWTVPTARDERCELELFGEKSTGINFSKYEDIPVEASGDNIPTHISSVSHRRFYQFLRIHVIQFRSDNSVLH